MPYSQFTLAQLQNFFYEQVDNNRSFWRLDEVTRILQESFRVFNCLTGFWRGQVNAGTTTAGTHWYTVPSGITYSQRVLLNGVPLSVSSLYDLDYGQPNWESETCASGQLPSAWVVGGVNLFAIWPASFAGGESLVIEGVVAAPTLTSTGFVNLGQDELETILNYAEHIAQFKEGGQEFNASQELLKDFLKDASSRNAILLQSNKFRTWMGLSDQRKRPMRIVDERVGSR